ncbi:MAG: class I SAM-dependent DNA methyltransferase, partial [Methylocella sp.]
MNESADYVMYWWDFAAGLLTRKGTRLKRFGLVTTNSLSQVFQRRVVERHLTAKNPVSLLMAIPDHPWTKATRDAAAVRIAMTVAAAGIQDGRLLEVTKEEGLDTDAPNVELRETRGKINIDLTVGANVTALPALKANVFLSSRGVVLHGAGFIVTPSEAEHLGLSKRPGLEGHIKPYRNGRDLTGMPRGAMVLDLFGLEADDIRTRFPEVYQHILERIKPERDHNPRGYRRVKWWLFGENVPDFRKALAGLPRYIATGETAKHRVFQFLDASILPDNKLLCVGLADAYHLGVLSSRSHVLWALRAGGWLGVGNDPVYVKSKCFDPFPFPNPAEELKTRIHDTAEELDGLRKQVQAEHPSLTLTQLYNVLEKLRAGEQLDAGDEAIKAKGLVLILRELHDKIDALVAKAYGWPQDLSDDEILEKLVTLNAERAEEEKRGLVRWLRPEYQRARAGVAPEPAKPSEEQLEA